MALDTISSRVGSGLLLGGFAGIGELALDVKLAEDASDDEGNTESVDKPGRENSPDIVRKISPNFDSNIGHAPKANKKGRRSSLELNGVRAPQ